MLTPPPYRMPPQPLYSEPASIPGSTTPSIQQMHTHSNKFPIEREVILSNYDKNSKIPILNEYHRKHKSSTVAPDAPNVQIAWSEDRTNRTYCDLRNTVATPNINVEFHRTYKAQPLSLLDSTTGTEPSPIVAQEDSNGFVNYVKSNGGGRSHSTPETDPATKAFPSRTYHTIKDMISSRFGGKGKTDQTEISLNNSENNHNENAVKTTTATVATATSSSSMVATPLVYAKADNTLSPHSQLVQRGVYLTSGSQQRNGPVDATRPLEMTSYREHAPTATASSVSYRERGVDVGQTAGVNQQAADANNKVRTYESGCAAVTGAATSSPLCNKPVVPARPPPSEIMHETPSRYRDQDRNMVIRNAKLEAGRNMKRFQNGGDGVARLNEMCDTFSAANSQPYGRQPAAAHNPQQVYDHCAERTAVPSNYHRNQQQHNQPASTSKDNTRHGGDEHRKSGRRLPDETPYSGATNAISRARSNDHLLDSVSSKSHHNRKDLPLKQRSKSFENLGNDNDDEMDKSELPKSNLPLNGLNSDYEKHRCGGHSDSGRGSTVYSSGKLKHATDTSPDSSEPRRITANKENQWADIVENELKHILEPKSNTSIANSTLSDSSTSPPLPPVSPDGSSDEVTPSYKHKGLFYGSKIETPYRTSAPSSHARNVWSRINAKEKINQRLAVTMKKSDNSGKIPSTVASSSVDLDSMLDEENTSDEEISVSDTRAIRKQLEGLENMYSEVMKLLGVKKSALSNGRYPTTDPRVNRRRLYGSVSSLPSSVSSRPIRDRFRRPEDRKKFVRDIKGINKRFQRLESHVVTLARSVAHLSSEMRTQHLMIQEMEMIRGELTNLRAQTNMLTVRSQSLPRYHPQTINEHVNSSPDKMKKLTKFFGDEPPLLRLFLKKLGYEKYATVFEKERIGLVELPYMTEERLQKLGIPMGPRLRIIQEAQLGFPGTHENTLCIV